MKQLTELVVFMIAFSLVMPAHIVFARPQGGNVVAGNANIHHSGNNTTINQNSDRAIINWHSFDIGRNEAVRHNMPSASSAALHRVVGGGGPSQIQGLLQSNGNIYLVNPAGVVIHNGARINTNSFTATSRDISNSNFMKGNMVFDRPGRPDAQIINQGNITVMESGLAALVAPTVRNEGVIAGKLAKVALASGDSTWKLDMHGDELITFTVDEKDVDTLYSTDGKQLGVTNNGKIKTEGGIVVMTAAQFDGIVNSVVNTGEVSAASAEVAGGKITFRSAGDITNTGVVDASSSKAKGGEIRMVAENKATSTGTIKATGKTNGGKVVVTGKEVALKGKAKVDVSGGTGGGTALIGGNALGKGPEKNAKTTKVEKDVKLLADAGKKGNGGEVVVWADEKTTFAGSISAKGGSEGGNGGKVETSGKSLKIEDGAKVDTSAVKGIHGQWLLDPEDFVIAESDGNMTGKDLSNNLEKGDILIESEKGNIEVHDIIEWHSNYTLTLSANDFINVYDDIILHGDSSALNILSGITGSTILNTGKYYIRDGKVTFLGNNNKYFINNNEYTLIRTIEELQNINPDENNYYALAKDIDASITKSWNNGEGFVPLEDDGILLHGGNHVVNSLYINRPNQSNVGLIGWTRYATVKNLGLLDVNITGNSNVGGIIGSASLAAVDIQNVGVTGQITGIDNVGGVVGSYNVASGQITNSYSEANINGRTNVGGFVGYITRGILDCYSRGDVIGENNVGGFAGSIKGGSFSNCYGLGNVVAYPGVYGSFAGYAEGAYLDRDYAQMGYIGQQNRCNFNFFINTEIPNLYQFSYNGTSTDVDINIPDIEDNLTEEELLNYWKNTQYSRDNYINSLEKELHWLSDTINKFNSTEIKYLAGILVGYELSSHLTIYFINIIKGNVIGAFTNFLDSIKDTLNISSNPEWLLTLSRGFILNQFISYSNYYLNKYEKLDNKKNKDRDDIEDMVNYLYLSTFYKNLAIDLMSNKNIDDNIDNMSTQSIVKNTTLDVYSQTISSGMNTSTNSVINSNFIEVGGWGTGIAADIAANKFIDGEINGTTMYNAIFNQLDFNGVAEKTTSELSDIINNYDIKIEPVNDIKRHVRRDTRQYFITEFEKINS